jgi:MFS family permease
VLLALVTAIGVFSVPYAAAASALLPDVVGEDEAEVARATAALQVAIQTTGVLGPAAAGLLIPLLGAPNLLLFDGASYAISAAIVAGLVQVGRARSRAERTRGLLVGVRHLRRDSLLTSIVAVAFIAHVGLAALFASLPALAFRSFHDARTAGVLFTADAVGSVLGGLAALWLARRVKPLRLGLLGFVLMSAPLWLLTVGASLPVALAAMFCFGIGGPLSVSPVTAVLTTRAPTAIRAQVISAFLAITTAGMPVGSAGAGFAIARVGFAPTYVGIAAAMTLATVLLAVFVHLDEAPEALAAATSPS